MTAPAGNAFVAARDFLLAHRTDYETAYSGFRWPELDTFNWALDYFDHIRDESRAAIEILGDEGTTVATFAELRDRSGQVANFLARNGVSFGDTILVILPNTIELWEATLAAIKLGAVVVPATLALTPGDIADRIERGSVTHVIAAREVVDKVPSRGGLTRIVVGGPTDGWVPFDDSSREDAAFTPSKATLATTPLFGYFTSGTTAKPKLVVHTHASYPVGHLSTMYWIGLGPGDRHMNVSTPGWAKHAWSSFFAPWNAEATIVVYGRARFEPPRFLQALVDSKVTTLCAPPTVWRMLILERLADYEVALRELVSAGEPLNPEVIDQVAQAWGITIRDGYGQTETTALVGNPPGQPLKSGSMGRPLPGYTIELLDPEGRAGSDGEVSVPLANRPVGLMAGYAGATDEQAATHYRTSDQASRDDGGYYWFVGRRDDVFKSSDFRISPFELESALLEHPDVAEVAIVPSPDEIRMFVPKAYITLRPDLEPTAAVAESIFAFVRTRLARHQQVRRIEFAPLPKTISGKIRRVELRELEHARPDGDRRPNEHLMSDFASVSSVQHRGEP